MTYTLLTIVLVIPQIENFNHPVGDIILCPVPLRFSDDINETRTEASHMPYSDYNRHKKVFIN